MIRRILHTKTKTVTFAAFLLAGAMLFSRLLGLFRNNLLGNLFPKAQTDVYLAAFRIPDFVYGILITGGIVAAFLPVFASYYRKDKQQAQALTNNVLLVFLVALVFISSILAILAPQLVKLVVPGFGEEQKALTATLSRLMFLSPILLGVSAIFSGLLQYFDLFLATALAPIFYNVGIILGILVLAPVFGLKGLAFGVILGAFLHLLIQIPPAIKAGFRFRFVFKPRSPGLLKIFKLMVPRTLGSAALHINLIVITAIASTLPAGSIRVFSFSNDLYNMPIGLIGISFAMAIFPTLSRNFVERAKEKFLDNFFATFSQILFWVIPLSMATFLLRAQIVRLFYGTAIVSPKLTGHVPITGAGGLFDWFDTRLTAASLGIFAMAIFAGCLIPLLARVFFSLHDTKTPVLIALFTMSLNVIFCYLFVAILRAPFDNFFQKTMVGILKLEEVEGMAVIGLPLGLAITSIFQFFLLAASLKQKIKGLNFKALYPSLSKVLISTILMGIYVYLTLQLGSLFLDTSTVSGLLCQTILAAIIGLAVYLILSLVLGSPELKAIYSSIITEFRK